MILCALFLRKHFQYTGTHKDRYTNRQNYPSYRPQAWSHKRKLCLRTWQSPIAHPPSPSSLHNPRMPPALRRFAISCLLVLSQLACQSVPDGAMREVVPVYGQLSDAVAVASGRFGAVPVALLAENQIELVQPAWCESLAVAVKLSDGRTAWVPWDTLPQRLKNSVVCPPMAS